METDEALGKSPQWLAPQIVAGDFFGLRSQSKSDDTAFVGHAFKVRGSAFNNRSPRRVGTRLLEGFKVLPIKRRTCNS